MCHVAISFVSKPLWAHFGKWTTLCCFFFHYWFNGKRDRSRIQTPKPTDQPISRYKCARYTKRDEQSNQLIWLLYCCCCCHNNFFFQPTYFDTNLHLDKFNPSVMPIRMQYFFRSRKQSTSFFFTFYNSIRMAVEIISPSINGTHIEIIHKMKWTEKLKRKKNNFQWHI